MYLDRNDDENARTVDISPNEITASATKATTTPFGPATVTA
jgi:hypothetical protein